MYDITNMSGIEGPIIREGCLKGCPILKEKEVHINEEIQNKTHIGFVRYLTSIFHHIKYLYFLYEDINDS